MKTKFGNHTLKKKTNEIQFLRISDKSRHESLSLLALPLPTWVVQDAQESSHSRRRPKLAEGRRITKLKKRVAVF